jgi:hypothetical protein
MKAFKLLIVLMIVGWANRLTAQQGEVINDTLWITPVATRSIEFSRAFGKVVYIRNIIPDDLPAKQRRVQLISSMANEIDEKQIIVINNKDLAIPLELFVDRYYTLYIKKSNATILSKKVIIR